MATETDISQTPLVKQLAANDRPTRDQALESLKTYLSGRRALPPLELLKLWKGLFYSMWMSDRPRTQAALASSLASLPALIPADSRIPFLRAYWQTMQREWTAIDVLRMEKFLLLTRRYLGATFELLRDGNWEAGLVEEHMRLLQEGPCEVNDARIPNGMRFHVIDIYVDELEKVGALEEDEDSMSEIPLQALLEPLRTLAKDSPTKAVRRKAKEALEDERIPGNEAKAVVPEDEGGWAGFAD